MERNIPTENLHQNNTVWMEGTERILEHIIMAHENSEAGDYYNDFAINYIRNAIYHTQHASEFDLVMSMVQFLNENWKQYVSVIDPKASESEALSNPYILLDEQGKIIETAEKKKKEKSSSKEKPIILKRFR